jgi:hypothetical protein
MRGAVTREVSSEGVSSEEERLAAAPPAVVKLERVKLEVILVEAAAWESSAARWL